MTDKTKIKFSDVIGLAEAKDELQDIINFYKDPTKFEAIGASLPHGIILNGPPGVGKTRLARAVAGEAGVNFYSASGAQLEDTRSQRSIGDNLRMIFEEAKKNAPAIIFLDEIDTIVKKRNERGDQCQPESPSENAPMNTLLILMDGFERLDKVFVLAATNRLWALDKALLRTGRFDVTVLCNRPNEGERAEMISYYLQKVPHQKGLDVEGLARDTKRFSGADIMTMVNRASIKAASANKNTVALEDLERAILALKEGPERRSGLPPKEKLEPLAIEAASIAVVKHFTPNGEPVKIISLIPRGRAAVIRDISDGSKDKGEIQGEMDILLAGYASEKVFASDEKRSNACEESLEKASELAKSMVYTWGMNMEESPRSYMWYEVGNAQKEKADKEITFILKESADRCGKLLHKHKKLVMKISKVLIEKMSMDEKTFEQMLEEDNK